ncbi:hypothetical protein MAPG_01088 [Magnaporthiopsis poae ATCC 64411]|uniref:Uncharacterized protein n=1 Tax=Magnaporthiopsis poae (strain ATCC 64411 / 73-15) TaxID=644358 RepID=A0A0C4DMS7_MAGP6|nr:hypothetical protein MAPG_01088 [Magnaporthiopsis poae ATCC 64411]
MELSAAEFGDISSTFDDLIDNNNIMRVSAHTANQPLHSTRDDSASRQQPVRSVQDALRLAGCEVGSYVFQDNQVPGAADCGARGGAADVSPKTELSVRKLEQHRPGLGDTLYWKALSFQQDEIQAEIHAGIIYDAAAVDDELGWNTPASCQRVALAVKAFKVGVELWPPPAAHWQRAPGVSTNPEAADSARATGQWLNTEAELLECIQRMLLDDKERIQQPARHPQAQLFPRPVDTTFHEASHPQASPRTHARTHARAGMLPLNATAPDRRSLPAYSDDVVPSGRPITPPPSTRESALTRL